jgi:hypothetical protein
MLLAKVRLHQAGLQGRRVTTLVCTQMVARGGFVLLGVAGCPETRTASDKSKQSFVR